MSYHYLALGDSYTIGEAVEQKQSFPYQLAEALAARLPGQTCQKLQVIATTGWTTGELLSAIEKRKPASDFQMVSLLIGVNNQYRKYDRAIFEKEFPQLLDKAIQCAQGQPGRVLVVAIPDYGCTPFGAAMAAEIDQDLLWYNAFCMKKALEAGANWVDIYHKSKQACDQPELLASDALHPSGLMYRLWVNEMLDVATKILTSN